jgi:hypothetical protein
MNNNISEEAILEQNSPKLNNYISEKQEWDLKWSMDVNSSYNFINDEDITIKREKYSLSDLSSLIFKHNQGIIMSKFNELTLEKESIIN